MSFEQKWNIRNIAMSITTKNTCPKAGQCKQKG